MKLSSKIVLEDLDKILEGLGDQTRDFEGKTVLITGGEGFLGTYLVLTLQHLNKVKFSKPVKIISLDNFITASRKRLLNFKAYGNYDFVEHDVRKFYKTRDKVDYIIHAAGIAAPVYYRRYPIEAIEVGTQGTKNFLELARKKRATSFMFFSSSEIYGNPHPDFIPTPETYLGNVSSIGPRSCYDESKRLGEALTMAYYQHYKSPVKIIRPFNVFGPGMKYNDYRVVPAFLMNAFNRKPLQVHGDGKHTRTFCYITDAVIGIYKVLLSKKNGEVYNIGNEKNEMQMIKLAKIIDKLFSYKVKIEKIDYPDNYPKDDPQRRSPDLSKIRKLLGYKPNVNVKTGLQRLKDWYQAEYGFK